jgi:hypothetical protein
MGHRKNTCAQSLAIGGFVGNERHAQRKRVGKMTCQLAYRASCYRSWRLAVMLDNPSADG